MKEEKRKSPELRFPGFEGDWEQRKVSDVCSISTGKSNTQDKIDGGAYPFYVRSPIVERSNRYLYDEEAVLTVGDGVGTGKVFHYVNGKYDLHQRVYRLFNFSDNTDAKFFYQWFSNKFYNRVMSMTAKTSVDSVRLEMIADMAIIAPSYDEQHKISGFLNQIDTLITLHQQKLDQIKEYKKGMLQKMFPKKGETVPEVRFPGFEEAWEEKKLGDYCDMFNGDRSAKYPNAQDMASEGIPFINAGDLVDGHVNLVSAKKITREKYNDLGGAKLQLGDIVYCLRGTLGKNAYINNFTEGTVASSLVAIRPKNIDGRFLFHILNSDIEYRQRIVRDEGAAQPNLSAKSVSEFLLPVPDIEEQKRISVLLDDLSNFITLHQCKIEQMKEYKKGLLQQMFV